MIAANVPSSGVFAPVLERLAGDVSTHYGVVGLQLVPVASYERPFSHILRLAVHTVANEVPVAHLFAKVLKPRAIEGGIGAMQMRVQRDFLATRRADQALTAHSDLGVVPPIACYPDLLAIVTEEVQGPTLLEYLEKTATWLPGAERIRMLEQTLSKVGHWIRVFQTTDEEHGYVTCADLHAYIDHRLKQLVTRAGRHFNPGAREHVLAHLDHLCASVQVEELTKVPVHADLALGNVLVSGTRIVVLDFSMAQLGSRVHDLTRLYVQLDQLTAKPRFRRATIGRLQHALLSGYDPAVTEDDPLFRLLVLLHRVNNLATVLLGRTSLTKTLYNRRIGRLHRAWIDSEMERARSLPARV